MPNCTKCDEDYYCDCEMKEKNITILKQGIRLDFYEVLKEMEMSENNKNLAETLQKKIETRIDEFVATLP